MNLLYIYMLMYFIFMIYLFFYFKHIMIFLMFMELLMLSNLCLLNYLLKLGGMNFYILLYFMVLVVCEAVLGLSLMVLIVRMQGIDYMKFLNLNIW